MAKVNEEKNGGKQERPNRSRYAERFSKAHPDVDFEDKEARYGAMNDDRDLLDSYEQSGNALGEIFDKHAWMGSMLEALRNNEDLDPVTWMADNGIDIQKALEDPEYRKTISQKIADFEKNQLEGKEAERSRGENLRKSAEALKALGLENEECLKLWNYLFEEVVDNALLGTVSEETWRMVQKAQNYDGDVENARNEGAMKARNEKIQNNLKQPSRSLPPDLASGAGATTAPRKKQEKSFAQDFFGDI